MIMKFKSFLMLAFVSMFAVAGMTSCSSDDDELIDESGEIIAPTIVHKFFGLSVDELKAKMAQANYSLLSSDNSSDYTSLVFNNNGVEPSKVSFYYEGGKMVSVEAYVSVNANNKMSHFNKWDAIMYGKKSDFPNFSALNDDLKKTYTKHDEFVATISEKTKSAVETMSNSKQAIILTIYDHNLTYYFGPVSPK